MNAKDAYELAKLQGDVKKYIDQIRFAAAQGLLEVALDHFLNEFQIKALTDLGYSVEGNYDRQDIFTSRSRPTSHKIVWRYAGDKSHKQASGLAGLLDKSFVEAGDKDE